MKTLKYILALVCLLCAMPAYAQSTLDGRRVKFPIPVDRLGTAGTEYVNGTGWTGGAISPGEDIGYNGAAYGFMYRNNLSPAIAASTSNVATLSGTTTIDGQAVSAGQEVLLTGQATGSQNGPWVVESGAWVRPFAYTSGIAMPAGLVCWVYAGSSNGPALWYLSGTGAATVDTSSTGWTRFAVSGTGTVSTISGPTGITWTNPTTTPVGSWSSQSAYAFLYNNSGSAGAPTFQALVNAALPSNIFASSQAPASVAASSETWSSSTEFIQWYASQTSGPANGAAEYYGWELSTNGGSTWGTEVFGGPVFTDPTGITSGTEEARARAYCLTVNGTSPTAIAWVTSSAQSYATSPYGGGGGSLPTDFISGALGEFDTTAITEVASGSAYNPIDSAVDTWTSALTNTPTLAASTFYYVYLSSGGAGLTVSSTAPATNYQGSAWEDGSGRRYLYSFVTNASSQIVNFQSDGGGNAPRVMYRNNLWTSPFEILTAGSSGTATSVSCTGLVPSTSRTAILQLIINASTGFEFGLGNGVTAGKVIPSVTTGLYTWGGTAPAASLSNTEIDFPLLVAGGPVAYITGGTGSLSIAVAGYIDNR